MDNPCVDYCTLLSRLKEQENQIKCLSDRIDAVVAKWMHAEPATSNCKTSTTVDELVLKNSKLKYRSEILQNAIADLRYTLVPPKTIPEELYNIEGGIQSTLSGWFSQAVAEAYPDGPECEVLITATSRPQFGDYQCSIAMRMAKLLKMQGISCSPMDVATNILKHMPSKPVFQRIELAKPGYLNIFLSKNFMEIMLCKIIMYGVQPPTLLQKQNVVVDFSSPNIAKEMHVGHLRSTIIGDSICRLLEFLGHNVLRLNHVGDWGTQFGMLIAHLQDCFPDYLTVSPPIADLQSFYKESKARFDSDPVFKLRAYSCVVKLQSSDPEYIKAWNLICDVSRKEFQVIYDKLDIIVEERGESFYQTRMEKLVRYLEEQGYLEEDEGRKVMFGFKSGEIPMTIVKSDGGFTYDTSDLACIKQRIEEEKADRIIYVTDSGQATHFKVLLSCAERAGILNPKSVRVDHVGFGVVLGEDKKKFKTRSGETVRLTDLLEEGVKRAADKLIEKERHTVLFQDEFDAAKTAVAYGCIKYADLSHNRINDYVFSFDKMLEDKGNTAVYLLYAITRIRSIARNADIAIEEVRATASERSFVCTHEKELKLLKVLLRFNDIVLLITEDLGLHRLCEYLYDVATTFTEFYDVCYCIEKDATSGKILHVDMNRILLCEATALIMEKCFFILGLKTVSRM